MSDIDLRSNSQAIDILVVIDTETIKDYWNKSSPARTPSQVWQSPTGLDHANKFMICTGSRGIISGQGTGDLHFKANVKDTVRFNGTSVYGNSEDAVIVYGISKVDRPNNTDVFNPFTTNDYKLTGAAQPNADSSTRNGLPALHVTEHFQTFEATVRQSGTEFFGLSFALYTLSADGQRQDVYGYFWWDPYITVA
ncbi:DNA-directed RNA polymerase subunit beta [Burkholderia lata]|uniref:DNA-directed RNA polymerase subunit beta n=1 Tax=Burkholderia lata (strain ATCC 17760 / DSM 23089 / LMG 22485 / NCIMB 9086 / R18194 / 383) TaxID=482957 RepID=A0A6P2NYT9_BURL3|nr:inclusion body family protein [Burkholderia lata]VWC00297.1 DNA-directed RNA polymerase subunit beta [Burkholderia lata]